MKTPPKYMTDFLDVLYPNYTELVLSTLTEKDCIVDATKQIKELRAWNKKIQNQIDQLTERAG